MTYLVWIWLGIFVLSAVLEFVSMQMVSIWFTASSLVSIILDLCGVSAWVQVLVFCLVALLLLIVLRKFCLKVLLKQDTTKTNVESFVGSVHKLIDPIKGDDPGSLKINGVVWTAVSEDEKDIKANEKVEIIKVDGNKLIVKKVEEEKGDRK